MDKLDLLIAELDFLKQGIARIEQREKTPSYVMELKAVLQTVEQCLRLAYELQSESTK